MLGCANTHPSHVSTASAVNLTSRRADASPASRHHRRLAKFTDRGHRSPWGSAQRGRKRGFRRPDLHERSDEHNFVADHGEWSGRDFASRDSIRRNLSEGSRFCEHTRQNELDAAGQQSRRRNRSFANPPTGNCRTWAAGHAALVKRWRSVVVKHSLQRLRAGRADHGAASVESTRPGQRSSLRNLHERCRPVENHRRLLVYGPRGQSTDLSLCK